MRAKTIHPRGLTADQLVELGEMNSQLTLPDEAPVSKQMSKLVSDKQEVRKELEISDLNKQEATSMFHARYLPIPKMLKAVAVMAVLVLAQVACTFTQGQDQIAQFQLQSKGKALVEFLQSMIPCKYQHSKKLISHDVNSNTYNYKYTFAVEVRV